MDDYKKLTRQPLKFVLAEFRFSQILQINKYIEELQDALRKKYPIPSKRTEQAVQVQTGSVSLSSMDHWAFATANKKSAVEVSQERLVYYTSEYPRFDGFSSACKEALDVMAAIVEPSLVLRIGLRYGDLVTLSESEQLSDLVDNHFILPGSITDLGKPRYQRSETVLTTESGVLAIRTLFGEHNLSCLPDIQGLPVTMETESTPGERLILDFDNSWEPGEEPATFEVDQILAKLAELHACSRKAFWQTTSDYARNEKWS